jgi:hypothetical protein
MADRPNAIIAGLTQQAYWNQILGCRGRIYRAIIEDLGIVEHLSEGDTGRESYVDRLTNNSGTSPTPGRI